MKVCLQLLLVGYRGRDGIVETHIKLAELIAKGDVEACIRELGHHLEEPVQSLQAERKSMLENRAAEEKRNKPQRQGRRTVAAASAEISELRADRADRGA